MSDTRTKQWFDSLRDLWIKKEISKVRNLLSDRFAYYEHPFADPLITPDQVESAWEEVLHQDILRLEILSLVCDDVEGTARYDFEFNDSAGKNHRSRGSYFVRLDDEGRAVEFRQWWVSK